MNGYSGHGLDENAFGEKPSSKGGLQTFDAFRTSHWILVHCPIGLEDTEQ